MGGGGALWNPRTIASRTFPEAGATLLRFEVPGIPPPRPSEASERKRPRKRPQQRLDRRLEEVARAVGGGYCRLQMPCSGWV